MDKWAMQFLLLFAFRSETQSELCTVWVGGLGLGLVFLSLVESGASSKMATIIRGTHYDTDYQTHLVESGGQQCQRVRVPALVRTMLL